MPPDLQDLARESYKVSLRAVFIFAAVMTAMAYLVRLPVRYTFALHHSVSQVTVDLDSGEGLG